MTYQLRPYQIQAVEKIGDQNTIVKMPTGSGKTFVAAEFIKRNLERRSSINSSSLSSASSAHHASAALFLVPACDLVAQQKKAIEAWIGNEYVVAEYMGGKSSPSRRFHVLVSTPQAFLVRSSIIGVRQPPFLDKLTCTELLSRNTPFVVITTTCYLVNNQTLQQVEAEKKLFAWSNFFACVFDECHHIIKDHPYRIIAHGINAWQSHYDHRIQILGLSASLTYAVGHKAVEAALGNLCYDLSVTNMISPTEEELLAAGYTPKDDFIEQMHEPWNAPEGVVPEHLRKTHAMYETFMERAQQGTNTRFATKIYKVVREIERQIDDLQDGRKGEFQSPLDQVKLAAWEEYAFQMKQKSSNGSPRQNLYSMLEIWYVALRMVVQSWEEEEQLVLQWLNIKNGFPNEGWFRYHLTDSLDSVERLLGIDAHIINSQKIKSLRVILTDKKKAKGVDFRGIIFVQQ
ncbi:hypothetical protein ACHAXS_004935, partial [Conticribra weissflogii]